MKTVKKWLTIIAVLLYCGTTSAYDFKVDGIYYNILSNSELTCEVTYQHEYNLDYTGDIVIPPTVTYGTKTYSVVQIGKGAFNSDKELTSVVLPEGITSICIGAFTRCLKLTSINFPKSLTNIEGGGHGYYDTNMRGAFCECVRLTSVVIPQNVKTIGWDAFYGCSNLKEVFVLGNTDINLSAFDACHSSCEIYYPEDMITIEGNTLKYGDTHDVNYTNKLKTYTVTLKDYTLETDAGSYTTNLNFSYSGDVEFDLEIPYTYTINKAPLTIKVNDAEKIYGDENPEFTYSFSGFVNNEDESALNSEVSFSTKASKKSGTGTYSVSANATAKNYEIGCTEGTLTVKKAPITVAVNAKSRVYGDANPQFDFTYVGLKNDDSVPVFTSELATSTKATKYSNVGEYEVSVSGGVATNYSFSEYQSGVLTITQAPLIISAQSTVREYGEANPEFKFAYSGFKNDDDEECMTTLPTMITSATPTSTVGEYELTPNGAEAENYAISYTGGTLTINKAPLTIQAEVAERVYGDENPKFTFSYSGFKNEETYEVLTNRPSAKTEAVVTSAVGTYDIVPSGAEAQNYDITYKNGSLIVTKAPLAVTVTSTQKVYGEENPIVEITYDGFKNSDNADCISEMPVVAIDADKKSDVGEYAITVSGGVAQNYEFTGYNQGVLTVEKASLTVIAEDKERLYFESNPEFTYYCEGFKNDDTKDVITTQPSFECNAKQTSIAGEYEITLSGAEAKNYELSYQGAMLTIGKRTIDVKVGDCTRVYNEENPEFSVSYTGFVNNENEKVFTTIPVLSCPAGKTTDVGSYEITASGAEATNYDFNYTSGILTIEKATQEIIWEQSLEEVEIGDQVELTALATSGLDIEYEIADNNFVSIYEAAGKVYLDCFGVGQIVIKAIQSGNKNYHSAVRVSKKLIVTDPSGIEDVVNDASDSPIYNIKGERMSCGRKELQKGIYIQNGKKFVVM